MRLALSNFVWINKIVRMIFDDCNIEFMLGGLHLKRIDYSRFQYSEKRDNMFVDTIHVFGMS